MKEVIIRNKKTGQETQLYAGLTEKQAESICEAWGWNYVDENCVSYWIEYRDEEGLDNTPHCDRMQVEYKPILQEDHMAYKWTEAQKRAQEKYDKNNTVQIRMKLNKKTDADVLAQLERVDNKQGYIKDLIRADMST